MLDPKILHQSTIQLLYSLHLEGSPIPTDKDIFWNLILEKDLDRLTRARIKAIEHITLDRADRLAAFEQRAAEFIAEFLPYPNAGEVISLLRKTLAAEQSWSSELDNLALTVSSPVDNTRDNLAQALSATFALAQQLNVFYPALINQIEAPSAHFPKHLSIPLVAAAKRLHRITLRASAIESPAEFPADPDLSHLRLAEEQIQELRETTNKTVSNLLSNLEAIDSQIAEVLENFVPERLDPVDRAILRLGTFELLFRPDRHGARIIVDAVRTAQALANSGSSGFINGVLNKIYKLNRPQG